MNDLGLPTDCVYPRHMDVAAPPSTMTQCVHVCLLQTDSVGPVVMGTH